MCTQKQQHWGVWTWLFCTSFHTAPPRFTRTPEDQTGVQGGVASFVCQATGDPQPKIVWNKKGKKVSNQRFEVWCWDTTEESVTLCLFYDSTHFLSCWSAVNWKRVTTEAHWLCKTAVSAKNRMTVVTLESVLVVSLLLFTLFPFSQQTFLTSPSAPQTQV